MANESWYFGEKFDISENYCIITIMMFSCYLFSFLVPWFLFLNAGGFLIWFCIETFNILRRYGEIPTLDSTIGRWLSYEAIFCVAIKMYFTSRLLYSWPFDSSYQNSEGDFVKVRSFILLKIDLFLCSKYYFLKKR